MRRWTSIPGALVPRRHRRSGLAVGRGPPVTTKRPFIFTPFSAINEAPVPAGLHCVSGKSGPERGCEYRVNLNAVFLHSPGWHATSASQGIGSING